MEHRSLLFRIGAEAGFYSEFNNMILARLWCETNAVRFILSSKGANFAPQKGWKTYFNPFCCEWNLPYQSLMNLRYHSPEPAKGKRARMRQWLFLLCRTLLHIDYLTYDVFWKIRKQDVNDEFILRCRERVKETYRFNKSTLRAIDKFKDVLPLPQRYVSLHIRRGDKVIETPHRTIETYMDKLQTISDCKDVFVATDDYSVFEELCQKYPTYRFYTLTPSNHRGYDQRAFDRQRGDEKHEEMIALFTDVELLAGAETFVGTLSSNIGMFLYLYMPQGCCFGVDFEKWRIW